jgi:hypothetical protein
MDILEDEELSKAANLSLTTFIEEFSLVAAHKETNYILKLKLPRISGPSSSAVGRRSISIAKNIF